MKVTWAVIFSLSCFAAVYGHPARREGGEEIEIIPLEDQNGGPVVDTGVIEGPWFSPFDGLFESLAGMMARMRQQMDYILRRFPVGNRTAEDSLFPKFPEIDLGKGNTTSVTKVIDGHKVVINETEFKQQGELGGAFFKVRIIDVLPDSSELTTDKNAEEITVLPKDTESVENSFENEIPKNKEIEVFQNIETFDEPDNARPVQKITTGNSRGDTFGPFRSREDNSLESVSPLRDISINQPDVSFSSQKNLDGSSKWATLEPFESVEDNSIESAYRPPDLSRDTYVNQVMADAGAPTNPDAEVFSNVEYSVVTGPRQPFEKITYPR